MLILNPDLINSCRVCRSPNQDGDYECLYQYSDQHVEPVLSEAGILYENLLDISLNARYYYPQFLCNSCDLQMKLFKKLKDKAYKTIEYLQNLYKEINNEDKDKEDIQNIIEYKEFETNDYHGSLGNKKANEIEMFEECEATDCQNNIEELVADQFQETSQSEPLNTGVSEQEEYITKVQRENTSKEDELVANNNNWEEQLSQKDGIPYTITFDAESNTVEQEDGLNIDTFATQYTNESKNNDLRCSNLTTEITQNSLSSSENNPHVRFKLEPMIDKNDYVTEIYELLDDEDECKIETNSEYNSNIEYDVCEEEKSEISSLFNDVEYVFEEKICNIQDENQQEFLETTPVKRKFIMDGKISSNTIKKREYRCQLCELEFKNALEYKLHRTQVHNEKYPCNVCSKEFKSVISLKHHMKTHSEQPAYQCEICQKTFNQKTHYQYHMNRHNNVRNFKCELCGKAFISKSDLKIHLRLHTRQRPYVCNVCGKDYLMMEHLKTHMIRHTDQCFQCDICHHNFTTHKTLSLHVKTIHADEPRFKCNICLKPFRRKHHLEYHLKLHPNNVDYSDSGYEMIDDPGQGSNVTVYNPDDLLEQDTIDDPGFIAIDENNV